MLLKLRLFVFKNFQ
jgi:hypothetical protein